MADADEHRTREPALAALLAESAEELYENAPCGYLSTLVDGTIVRVNGTLLRWLGYDRDAVLGRMRFHELLAAGDRIFYETHTAPLLRLQGAVREIAVELVRADGRRLPALVNSVVKTDASGAPHVIRTTVFDATDRRAYEKELLRARREAESRAAAAHALAHVGDGILLVDAAGRVALLNAAGAAILGVASDAVVGRPADAAIPGWGALAARAPVGQPDRWPAPVLLPFQHAGSEQWLTLAGVDSGEGVVYTVRDVTGERELEALRSDVIATVSHELRTPLAAAYGAAVTLRDRYASLGEDSRTALLEMMVEQGERLTRIVDEILLTSALARGDVELALASFDATALAQRVSATFRAAGATVAVQVDEPVRVRADESRTEQVLVNLVENAVKYAPRGSPVRVTVGRVDGRARFTVADEGPGIPPAERVRIFEKFYRLDPDQRSGVGGLGLGLYIARELVERMNGRIGLLPAAEGTAFHVDLPLAGEAAEPT